jgi:hypothetical protein
VTEEDHTPRPVYGTTGLAGIETVGITVIGWLKISWPGETRRASKFIAI